MKTSSTKKLIILALTAMFAMPVFAQRHAMNDNFFSDTNHRSNSAIKRVITFGFFSPINQHLSFSYEQPLNYQMVLTTRLGIIGPGLNLDNPAYNNSNYTGPHPLGAYIACGVKLFIHPDFIIEGMRRYNTMQGFYFMPEIIAGNFNYTTTYSYYTGYPNNQNITGTNTSNITNYAVILNLGKQWVFGEHFLIGIHAGIGYGGYIIKGGNINPQQYPYYNYNDFNGGNFYDYLAPGPFAYSGGVDIGVIF